jgi:hypothetical protein
VNRRFTEELLALLFKSRIKRLKRMQEEKPDHAAPRRVSNEEFFNAPLSNSLSNPNQMRIKRVLVKPN